MLENLLILCIALHHLELWEHLFDMCLVDYYDEIMRGPCGISYEDSLTADETRI